MIGDSLVCLFAERELGPTRPLRCELRRRGARVRVASTLDDAVRHARLLQPGLFVLDDGLGSPEIPDVALYFRTRFPRSEIILLNGGSPDLPSGLGLGLLYSGRRPVANDTLLEVLLAAFPHRLDQSDPKECLAGTVLCVDDDRRFLDSLGRLLRRRGYQASLFENGSHALEAIQKLAPDLAILDVRMPGMNGLHLARAIRNGYGGLIPVVLLSGKASSADRVAGYLHGACRYVSKDGDPLRLLDVVDYYAGDLDAQERELLELRL